MQEYSTVLKQNTFEKELIILISKYIKEEIQFGQAHKNDIDLAFQSSHLPQDYLLHVCKKFAYFLDNDISPTLKPIKKYLKSQPTLFHSLDKSKSERYDHPFTYCKLFQGRTPYTPNHYTNKIPHQTRSIFAREQCGAVPFSFVNPPSLYKENFSRYFCTLGHLSSVYCVLFDRTGHYIFTGADDHLVKIWGAWDGRLLATLRGHTAEITDLTINWENTLLGASSTNKIIRVWSLKSNLAPVAVLTGHSAMISMLQFSPYSLSNKRYLVSCGNDGNVCIWSYDASSHDFDPNPLKFIERARPGNQMLCTSFSPGGAFLVAGGSDHFTRIYYFGNDRPEKIEELEVHTDRVDSIKFANNSIRFVTGSRDGLACIWSLSNKKWNCLILYMANKLLSDKDEENKSSKLRVTMVSWNCDDSYVLTAITNFKIKVWDSYKGTLIHEMKAHTDDIFVLEYHPYDPKLVVSASHDGYFVLWDITTGAIIKRIFNNIENRGHGAIFDCKFSPHGLLLAATDSHGQLIIMGLGTNKEYEKSTYEQFFHTDFRPLVRDVNNYVIDEQTQLAPHLMPAPFLVDIDGNPFPPHVQRRVPGRHNCHVEQLVPNVLPNEDGEMEILDFPASSANASASDQAPVATTDPAPDGDTGDLLPLPKRALIKSLQNRIIYTIDPMLIRSEVMKKREMAESEIRAYTDDGSHRKVRVTRQHPAIGSGLPSPSNNTTKRLSTASLQPSAQASAAGAAACSSSSTNSSRGYFSDIINKYANIALNKSQRNKSNESQKRNLRQSATSSKTQTHSDSCQSSVNSSSWSKDLKGSTSSSSHYSTWEDATILLPHDMKIKPLPKRNCISIHQKVKRRRTSSSATIYGGFEEREGIEGDILGDQAIANAEDWGDSYSTSAKSDDSDWIQDYRSGRLNNSATRDDHPEGKIERGNKFKRHRTRRGLAKAALLQTHQTSRFSQRLTRAKLKDPVPVINSLPPSSAQLGSKRRQTSSLKIWAAGAKRLATSYQRKHRGLLGTGKDRELPGNPEAASGHKQRWWLRRAAKGAQPGRAGSREFGAKRLRGQFGAASRRSRNPGESQKRVPLSSNHGYNTRIRSANTNDGDSPNSPSGSVQLQPSSLFFPPEWMTETLPRGSPFIPQIGDEVIYLRQGHERYVRAIRQLGLYPLENKSLPYVRQPSLRPVEYAKVTGLKFEIRPPRLCCVKLSIIHPDNSLLTGGLFTLKFHDVAHVVDFLVLKQVFERSSVCRFWDGPDRKIRAFIDDRWWHGTLTSQVPLEAGEYSASPFLKYTVKWDNGDTEKMSPWDMEPFEREESDQVVAYKCRDENGLLNFEVKPGDWSIKLGRDHDCARIKKGLESVMSLAIAEPFAAPVDLRAYPAYAQMVPYPIDLNTIKERVGNHFYRRRAALVYDIRMILSNAQTFNESKSIIVEHAKLVVDLCENLVNDHNCQPLLLYKRLMCDQLLNANDATEGAPMLNGNGCSTSANYEVGASFNNNSVKNFVASEPISPRSTKDWSVNAFELLREMLSLDDSEPFRQPVNLQEYPEYLSVIKHPMDLSTVQQNLQRNLYKSPQELRKDIRLILANSRAYNTNKRSRIYGMTLRLSALFEERMRKLIDEDRSRMDRMRILRYSNRRGPSVNINNNNRDNLRNDDMAQGVGPAPNKLGSLPTSAGSKNVPLDDGRGSNANDNLTYNDLQRHRGNFRGLRSFAAAASSHHDLADNPPRSSPPLIPSASNTRADRRSRNHRETIGSIDYSKGLGAGAVGTKRCLRSFKTKLNYDESDRRTLRYDSKKSITDNHRASTSSLPPSVSHDYQGSSADDPKTTDASSVEESGDVNSDGVCDAKYVSRTQLLSSSKRVKATIYTSSSNESTVGCDSNATNSTKDYGTKLDDQANAASSKKYDLRHKKQSENNGHTPTYKTVFGESSDHSSSSNNTVDVRWRSSYGGSRSNIKTKASASSAPCRRSSRRSAKIRQDSDFEYECY